LAISAVAGHQRVVSSLRVPVGLDGPLDRLPPRGAQAARQALVQAGAPAREHLRNGSQPCSDVPPVLVIIVRQQVRAIPDFAKQAERRAQVTQRLTRLMPGQPGLQPLAHVQRGQPVAIGGDRHAIELGQRAGHQIGPRLMPVGTVIGRRPEGLGKEPADPDRIECRPPRYEVIGKPEHWRHGQ
jgi:hypothetical protein